MPTSVSENESTIESFTPSPVQSEAPIFTSTAFLTNTPEATVTLTPLPTLSQPISESEIKQLLQNDVDCRPPCFLGVVPEKTPLDELRNIFSHFGLPLHDYEGKGLAYAIEQFPNSDVPPQAVFHISNGQVKSTRVYLNQSNSFEWSMYSPSAMLKRFGAPSQVTFGLQVIHEPTPTPWKGWYRMTFFYDDLDLIVNYGDPEIRLGEFITVCPNKDDFEGVSIWLGKSPSYPPLPTQDGPLEQVTSFTPERFRDFLLLGPGACFDLKASAIPIY